MNRRRFLQWLGGTAVGAAAALTLDVDRLLWLPGEKTIFLPTASSDGFNAVDVFAREALKVLEKNLAFAAQINREYASAFGAGRTVVVEMPRRSWRIAG